MNILQPCLAVVKASLKHQWAREIIKWDNGKDELGKVEDVTDFTQMPFIVSDGRKPIIPGFKWYIISQDVLKKHAEALIALNFQCIIVDESQHFKDVGAARTKALHRIVENIPHRMCLSATPILNRASEYHTTLRLIDPKVYYSKIGFERRWCEFDYNRGRYTRIKPHLQDQFKKATENCIIRRLKSEVATDLPSFARYLELLDIENPLFKEAYEKGRRNLEDFLNRAVSMGKLQKYGQTIALLSKLRQIVGIAKVEPCVELVNEFMESTDRKLCIGVHHKKAGELLRAMLAEHKPLVLVGGMTPEAKDRVIQQFDSADHRIMIASTLAAGEGLNLQFCSDAILMERQWNSAKEVQFEGRFNRIGQTHPVEVKYLVARNSLDEWMSELVEAKRNWVSSAIELEGYDPSAETDLDIGQLAQITAQRRML